MSQNLSHQELSPKLKKCERKFLNRIDHSEDPKFYDKLFDNIPQDKYYNKIEKCIIPVIRYGDIYISFAADYAKKMTSEKFVKNHLTNFKNYWDFFNFAYAEINDIWINQEKKYCFESHSLLSFSPLLPPPFPFLSMHPDTYLQFYHYGPLMKKENDRAINPQVFNTLKKAYEKYAEAVEEAYKMLQDFPEDFNIANDVPAIQEIAKKYQIKFKTTLKAVCHWRDHGRNVKADKYFEAAYKTIANGTSTELDLIIEFKWIPDEDNPDIYRFAIVNRNPLHLVTYFTHGVLEGR